MAPAKVNLGLWVGEQEETGYHPIDTLMHTIRWFDTLHVEPAGRYELTCSSTAISVGDLNLVTRAWNLAVRQWQETDAWRVHIEKKIPIGAGLGGGSSDGAAFLRFLANRRGISSDELQAWASDLGKDVPFLLTGGAARATGYGEQLSPFPSLSGLGILLVNPGFSVNTRDVYDMFDRQKMFYGNYIDAIPTALGQGLVPEFPNALERAAWAVEPKLRDFYDWMSAQIFPLRCWLSGSGATYYVVDVDNQRLEYIASTLRQHRDLIIKHTQFLDGY